MTNGHLTANVYAHIIDKELGTADNFKNGKIVIEIKVVYEDIDDVLDAENPLKITIWGREKEWSVPTINLRENSGKTEANYGETIECDGVVAGPDNSNDNLYVKISVPTTAEGNVAAGMNVEIEMWPTDDAANPVDGIISPASFDNEAFYDWWNENNIIDIYISAKRDTLTLTGFDGAYLIGTEIDE